MAKLKSRFKYHDNCFHEGRYTIFQRKQFILNSKNFGYITDCSHAIIENGKLKIRYADEYMQIMSAIARSEGVCAYCGKKLNPDDLTIDHMTPKCQGGATILANICPACSECNNEKAFLTPVQFDYHKLLLKEDCEAAQRYFKDCEKQMKADKKCAMYFENLAGRLNVRFVDLSDIVVKKSIIESEPESIKREHNEESHILTYGKLRRPMVVDENMTLLEAKHLYILAEKYGMKKVPVIVLFNVECIES